MATDESAALPVGAITNAGSAEGNNIIAGLSEEARLILAYMVAHPQMITWAMPLAMGLKIGADRFYPALAELVQQNLITETKEVAPPVGRGPRSNYTITNLEWCRVQFERLYADLLQGLTSRGVVEAAHR